MKLPLLILTFILCETLSYKSANASTKTDSSVIVQHNQSADLVTQPVTIDSNWNYEPKPTKLYFSISDPECKKINPLNYLNNPESFFKECVDTNKSNRRIYDPVEYLKVPPLDSGINFKLGDF